MLNAAFDDLAPLAQLQDRKLLERALRATAIGNLIKPLRALLARAPAELDLEARDPHAGWTALLFASQSGADHAVRFRRHLHVHVPMSTMSMSMFHVRLISSVLPLKVLLSP